MKRKIITSECVSFGHPDKIADIISDTLVEEFVKRDKKSRCGIEVLVKDNVVVLGGEVNSTAKVDYDTIIRNVFAELNFPSNHGLDPEKIKIVNLIGKQSPEIHKGVDKEDDTIGAGDQGFMVGYASNDTDIYMPIGYYIARKICNYVSNCRPQFGPDTKTQVVVEHFEDGTYNVKSILVSTMSQAPLETTRLLVEQAIVSNFVGIDTDIFEKHIKGVKIDVNPCGEWKIGGSVSDCGVTGRKIVVDQFGGYCNVGGGAFSGKDMTKVDRSSAYMCRYLAKNIVASGLCNRAKVELAYMIGVANPCGFNIVTDTNVDIDRLKTIITDNVDLTPKGIMERFEYENLTYSAYAWDGHYGFNVDGITLLEKQYPWEKLDLVSTIKENY